MAHQPALETYDTLNNKTFYGLLIAEFLAAFNDQCIHASAMFFAIEKQTLTESQAISLMPLLFYLPWALFAPLAGYFADRYSKRTSLIFWKVAEIGITGMALLGFWLGRSGLGFLDSLGPWLVMSAVFLMGTHSTFYVPNKYGVLPEIFTVRMLSRANGLIESTTFLAVILGTTTGGILSYVFKGQEYYLGLVLVVLAFIGTVTSYFIRRMPPADPNRPFPGWLPWEMFRPIFRSVVVLARSRLASVAILGLAFYVFMLVYMRQSMYMFGESRNPRWTEQDISLIVAVVSLGVGLGSPLAGFISGGKVELGLVPVGALGIILSLTLAGVALFYLPLFILGIVLIGMFSAFYLVPLYSLLQYSAPKGSKGQSVATNNFICTLGSVSATVVFFLIVNATHAVGVAERFDLKQVGTGTLTKLEGTKNHPHAVAIARVGGEGKPLLEWHEVKAQTGDSFQQLLRALLPSILGEPQKIVVRLDERVNLGDEVAVSEYAYQGTTYYHVRPADAPPPTIYNNEQVPRFLFLGAAVMMLIILVLLARRLPDFFLRSLIFVRSITRPIPRAYGSEHVPFSHAVLLMDCDNLHDAVPVLAGIVRPIRLILPDRDGDGEALLYLLARRAGMIFLKPSARGDELAQAVRRANEYAHRGYVLAVSTALAPEQLEMLLTSLRQEQSLALLPVWCHGRRGAPAGGSYPPVEIDAPLPPDTAAADVAKLLDERRAQMFAHPAVKV